MRAVFLLSILLLLVLSGCGGSSDQNANGAAGNKANAANAVPEKQTAAAQNIVIDSRDGVKLAGTYFDSGQPNSPGLLLLHQWQSDRHSFDEFARRMQGRGFAVLSIDGRGFGESVKTADGRNIEPDRSNAAVKAMLDDVHAATEFLAKQENVDSARIGIVGASYGSSLALIYAAGNPKVAAIALLSPGLNYFGNMQAMPAIKKYGNRPLFMAAAEDDKESADAVTQLFIEGDNAAYSAKVYGKGGHGTDLLENSIGAEADVEKFLISSLMKNAGKD